MGSGQLGIHTYIHTRNLMTIVTSQVLELANKAQFLYNLSGLFKMSSKCLMYEYMYGNSSDGMWDIMYM